MYLIENIYNASMEAYFEAFDEGKRTRWMANFAWFFGRQYIGNSNEFWLDTAAKLTHELTEEDREAVVYQLNKPEDSRYQNPPAEYPPIPQTLIDWRNAYWNDDLIIDSEGELTSEGEGLESGSGDLESEGAPLAYVPGSFVKPKKIS